MVRPLNYTTYAVLTIVVIGMIAAGGCSQTANYQVKVIYEGNWQGAMGDAGSIKSIAGSGTMTYTLQNPNTTISFNAQKLDGSSQPLTVQILKDGTVIKSGFTDAPYGSASIGVSL